jgi:hypothetical protein
VKHQKDIPLRVSELTNEDAVSESSSQIEGGADTLARDVDKENINANHHATNPY